MLFSGDMASGRPACLYFPLPRSASQLVCSSLLNIFPETALQKFKSSSLSLLLVRRRTRPRSAFSVECSSPESSSSLPSPFMESPPDGYRRNVGICLIDSPNKIFAASRLDVPDSWQMPQGGIDENEDPRAAAVRELKEETGVQSAEIIAETPYWLTYDFPPEVRERLKRQWGTDWKGQAQKWFLLKFNGKEEEINLLGDGSEKPEFGQWSWMSPEQVIEHVVDFKKPVYKEVFSVFAPHLQSSSSGPV